MKKFILFTLSFVFALMIFLGVPSNALALKQGITCDCLGFSGSRVANVSACDQLGADDYENLNENVYSTEVGNAHAASNFPGSRNNQVNTQVTTHPFTPQTVLVDNCSQCEAKCENTYKSTLHDMTQALHLMYIALEETFKPQGCVELDAASQSTKTHCEDTDSGTTDGKRDNYRIFNPD